MQVKPHYNEYFKIKEWFQICTDDTGNNFRLAHIIGKTKNVLKNKTEFELL